MKLNQTLVNHTYIINKFENTIDDGLYNKLISMGLGEGTILVTSNTNSKKLISFYVDNIKFCIRNSDANYILVGELNE